MPLAPSCAILRDDERLLIQAARDYAESELLPRDRAWDRGEGSVNDVLPALGELGFLSMLAPADLDGLGCSYRVYASILHEISRWSPSTCVTLGVHNMVGTIVDRWAKGPLRTEWLSRWGRPESFAAFAVSEAGTGSDALSVKTTATESNDGFRLNGEKMWVTNGMKARWLLTMARMDGGSHHGKLAAFMLDGRVDGVERTTIKGKMGIRGSETAVIGLHGALVPREHLLGEIGQGWDVCLSGLIGGRIGIAAQATGIAEACVQEMVSYARQREQFGQPIGKFQAVADMIATSDVELEAAKVLVWRACADYDEGRLNRAASSMAKLYATEAANRIAYRAVQVHGGTGYVNECRAEQLYRDARITTIYEGTSEIQRIVVSRELQRRHAAGLSCLEDRSG